LELKILSALLYFYGLSLRKASKVLRYCENKPEVVVDRGFWYRWTLERLGLEYRYETFGERNAVERFFSSLKGRTKRFWNRLPFRSSFDSVQSWLESFVGLYNTEMLFLTNPSNQSSFLKR